MGRERIQLVMIMITMTMLLSTMIVAPLTDTKGEIPSVHGGFLCRSRLNISLFKTTRSIHVSDTLEDVNQREQLWYLNRMMTVIITKCI